MYVKKEKREKEKSTGKSRAPGVILTQPDSSLGAMEGRLIVALLFASVLA